MSRLADLSASPMLKEYAQGAAQEAIQPVAEFIAPTVPVPTSVGRFKKYDEKNRFHIPKTLRGLGGRATELSFAVTDATYNCAPHALDFPVDNLEALEEASLENLLQEGATLIAEVAGLAHEKAVVDIAIAGVAAGNTTTPTWVTNTTDDAVNNIDTAILNTIKAAKYGSLMGVGVLFGAGAFKSFKNSTAVRSRFVVSGSPAFPNVTPDVASSLFIGTPDVRVSYMVYDNAPEGVVASMTFVLDKSVLVFARKPQPTRRDPSFMKTFRLTGHFMVPGSYMKEDQRGEVAKYDWSEDIQLTNSPAAYLINPSDI